MHSPVRQQGATMPRAVRAAAGGLAVAAGLAACGGSGGQDSRQAVQAVQAAYKTTTSAESVTVSLSGNPSGSPSASTGKDKQQKQRVSGKATLDYANNASTTTVDVPGSNDTETRTIDSTLYRKLPEGQRKGVPGKKPWIKVDLQKLAKVQYGKRGAEVADKPPTDPAGILTYLRGATKATSAGSDKIRGAQTTHYTVTVNLQKAAKGRGPEVSSRAKQLRQQLGKKTMPMQVWLDGDGRVRRLQAALPGGGQQGSPKKIQLAEDFYDYNQPVDISAPSKGKTADVTKQLVQRQRMMKMRRQMQQQQQMPQQQQPQQQQQQQQQQQK